MNEFVSQKIVCLGARYIWRGTLLGFDGPMLVMGEDTTQVTDHSETEVRQEMPVGKTFLNPASLEAVYLQSGTKWCPQ